MIYFKSTLLAVALVCLTACSGSGKVSNEADTLDSLDDTDISINDVEEEYEYTDEEEVSDPEEATAVIQGANNGIVDDNVVTEVKSQDEIQRGGNRIMTDDDAYGVDDASKSVVTKEVVIVEEKPKAEVAYDLADVDVKPEYPGGEKAMYEFMSHNIHYPEDAHEDGIQGTVVVLFTISSDGTVTNAKAVRSPHSSLSNESVRMVMSMPKWTPARHQGQPVAVYYTLPVRFKLNK